MDTLAAFKSYAYIDNVTEENGSITLLVSGANGDTKLHHYKLEELGNGIYELMLYASIHSGNIFPYEIRLIIKRANQRNSFKTK